MKHQLIAAVTNPIVSGSAGSAEGQAKSGQLFFDVITGILVFWLALAAIIFLINLVQAGIAWLGSGGDSSKVEKARSRITNSIVGFIILVAAYAIWRFVLGFLNVNITFQLLVP